jgi:hypothetical protein
MRRGRRTDGRIIEYALCADPDEQNAGSARVGDLSATVDMRPRSVGRGRETEISAACGRPVCWMARRSDEDGWTFDGAPAQAGTEWRPVAVAVDDVCLRD